MLKPAGSPLRRPAPAARRRRSRWSRSRRSASASAPTIAIFGAINGLLLGPVGRGAPDRLVAVFTSDFSGPRYGVLLLRRRRRFRPRRTGARRPRHGVGEPLSLTAGNEAERVFTERVSPNYFDVLGLTRGGRPPAEPALDSTAAAPRRRAERIATGSVASPAIPASSGETVRLGQRADHDRRRRARLAMPA